MSNTIYYRGKNPHAILYNKRMGTFKKMAGLSSYTYGAILLMDDEKEYIAIHDEGRNIYILNEVMEKVDAFTVEVRYGIQPLESEEKM